MLSKHCFTCSAVLSLVQCRLLCQRQLQHALLQPVKSSLARCQVSDQQGGARRRCPPAGKWWHLGWGGAAGSGSSGAAASTRRGHWEQRGGHPAI